MLTTAFAQVTVHLLIITLTTTHKSKLSVVKLQGVTVTTTPEGVKTATMPDNAWTTSDDSATPTANKFCAGEFQL